MDTTKLRQFSKFSRNTLISQISGRMEAALSDGSTVQQEHPKVLKKLEAKVSQVGSDSVIEKVAYIWFNRFTALRYLDVNGLSPIGVVSPSIGQFQPEILADAKSGSINEQIVPQITREKVLNLLNGRVDSLDPQGEAYRLLVVAACNFWHKTLPFMFELIDDYTELLMPSDLQSNASILAYLREAMTPDVCKDVEIIGWLYQFYISEKKEHIFAGLEENPKITAENIPAATQLFTPHWIVRYLVENSLGRLWLLNRPDSRLAEQMDYFIRPEEPAKDFLKITRPEEIRICDPAVGSGHMLTYAFDLLYAIYEEEGYDATDIPALILTHNLTGMEIDDRAGALAAFALAMKAAAKLGRRRFLRMEAKPDICVFQNIVFSEPEMQDVATLVGDDLFSHELRETLGQFKLAKNYGSLIVPELRDPSEVLRTVEGQNFGSDLLLSEVQRRAGVVLRMVEALSPNYHVVVANPPYMGSARMNDTLKSFAGKLYKDSKFDLYAMFMERGLSLCKEHGTMAMITMQSWMFLSSFQRFREKLFSNVTLLSMAHLGERAFDTISGAVISTTSFVLQNAAHLSYRGDFVRLIDGRTEDEKCTNLKRAISDRKCGYFYRASVKDFKKIPGSPFAYWSSPESIACFENGTPLKRIAPAKLGMRTGNNNKWLRMWFEVSSTDSFYLACDATEAKETDAKWFPYNKGGRFRRWYGNNEIVIFWEDDGFAIKKETLEKYPTLSWENLGWKITNESEFFRPSCTLTFVSSSMFGVRVSLGGALFDVGGSSAFPVASDLYIVAGFMSSSVAFHFLKMSNPTLNFQVANVNALPWIERPELCTAKITVQDLVELSKSDWDAYETSWDFTTLPLLSRDHRGETLEDSYATLRAHWQSMTDETQRLEKENNRIFIGAYGLQEELTPEVPIEEITLTCNPAYRYGVKGTKEDREARLCADTMAEFLSYAVACMFGRYSLDAPGLILANQGDPLKNYFAHIPAPSFVPDKDNVVPVLDGDWFPDDITERFRLFLRVTFGETHFRENLRYIEKALGKSIRKYFTKNFYADHVKRYKKRPIYWMFSSPNGTFNALIYLHRYRADTVSVLLNDYLREFISKLEGERGRLEKLSDDLNANQGQRTKALKEVAVIAKQIDELNEWERDVVFPLAQARIEIDLDDGVKANYPKFGTALKKGSGLEAKND